MAKPNQDVLKPDADPQCRQPAKPENQAGLIVRLADADCIKPFHDPSGVPYATIKIADHWETHGIRSKPFKSYLTGLYWASCKQATSRQAIDDALAVLEARALFEGDEEDVWVRLAEYKTTEGAGLVLDLGDSTWRSVLITRHGWSVQDTSSVRFRRPRGMLALPEPVAGGTLRELAPFVNADNNDFTLIVAWLLGAYRATGPFPVLVVGGQQGSAKSTTLRVLRRLIDPNVADLRTEPRDERDLLIAATSGRVLMFDNVSTLAKLSDAICRLATGAGFSTRTLYTDADETLINVSRPCALNSIVDVVVRGDLADRSLVVTLPPLPDTSRRPEADFWRMFESARPRILGALLDAVVLALKRENHVHAASWPRMADFARWVVAAEPRLPWPAGSFLDAYSRNRLESAERVADGDELAELVTTIAPWRGTATELLHKFNETIDPAIRGRLDWRISTPKQLTAALRRLQPALVTRGISIDFNILEGRERKRSIVIGRADHPGTSITPSITENRPVNIDDADHVIDVIHLSSLFVGKGERARPTQKSARPHRSHGSHGLHAQQTRAKTRRKGGPR